MILMAPAGPSSQRMKPNFVTPHTSWHPPRQNVLARVASRRRQQKVPRDVERSSDPYSGGRGAVMDGVHAASALFAGSRVGARDERVGASGG